MPLKARSLRPMALHPICLQNYEMITASWSLWVVDSADVLVLFNSATGGR